MGIFSHLREKEKAEEKRIKEVRHTHRRGLDDMPNRYKLQLFPWLLILQLFYSALSGAFTGMCVYYAVGQFAKAHTLQGAFCLAVGLLPLQFFLKFFRRLLQTLTFRFDVYGGMVTEFETKTEEHWDSEEHRYKKVNTYFVTFNNHQQQVSGLRSLTLRIGDYCLLARYRSRYIEKDAYITFKTSPAAEENRLTDFVLNEPVRLYRPAQMPKWSTVLPAFVIPAAAMLLWMASETKRLDDLFLGMRPDLWIQIGWGCEIVMAALVICGFCIRFNEERKSLATKRNIQKGGNANA